MKRFRRPSYTTVIAHLALLAAVTGSAYAATKIGSQQIKDGSIQGRDVKNRTLTNSDVKPNSLTAQDFKDGELAAGSVLTGRLESLTPFGSYYDPEGSRFAYPQGETPDTGLDEAAATELSPATAVTARDLSVKEDHLPTNGIGTRNYILRVNGQDTALRCSTTADPDDNPTGTLACSDTNDEVAIPPGSTMTLRVEQNYYTGGGRGDVNPVRFGFVVAAH